MKQPPMKKAAPAARVAPVRKPVPQSVPELRLEIEYVDPKILTLWDANPRRNDRAAKKLAEIIRTHGFGQPVTARIEDGVVYKGNTRVKAAIILGMDSIPVMRRNYPDVEDAIRDAVADNRMQEMAEWDEDALAELFKERAEVDIDQLSAETGFEAAEIRGLREGWRVPGADPANGDGAVGAGPRGNFATKCPHCGNEGSVLCGKCRKEFDL